ncbi:MAG: DUF6323 family protein [Bacillota bacterium]|nr:DUF6323 family protein [Bacillota bacterium]
MKNEALFSPLKTALKKGEITELTSLNIELREHGLSLTQGDAEDIVDLRDKTLKNLGRVELDMTVSKELIKKLSDSPYITQDTLVETVADAYDVFHFIKNLTSDQIPDEDIISAITVYFNEVCRGSAELLMGKGAECIIKNYKEKKKLDDIEPRRDEEFWNLDD